MQDIYEIVLTFFCVYDDTVSEVAMLLCIIPLKQLSGFKWWRTSLYVILSYLAALAILLAAMLVAIEKSIWKHCEMWTVRTKRVPPECHLVVFGRFLYYFILH